MSKLSLCTIVKNEEVSLPKCLASVKDTVDEMVILDTGSTDRTVEIAREFGARVYNFQWCDDFSAARNEALKYVQGDWILILDADEVLNPEIGPEMRAAIANPNYLVVNLIRQEVGASQSPYSLLSRLFRHHPALKFSRPYHALIDDSVAQLRQKETNWKIVDLPSVAIFHYGYQPEAINALDKYERARKAMTGFLAQHPNDSYTCSKLGGLYLQIGQEKEGIRLLKRGLKCNRGNPHTTYELHYHLANAYARQQKLEPAAKHYRKAIEQPILAQLKIGAYNNLGSLLQLAGDLLNAQRAYEIALQITPDFAVGYYNLGMTLKAMGRWQEAIAAYQKALKLAPNYAACHQNLGVVLYKVGKLAESLESFQKAIALYDSQNSQEAERLRQGLRQLGMVE
jgi:glycosyltransferase involved in cell wall biosynthesis